VHSDLVITNRTGWKLAAIYLSPTDAPTWEENLLGADSLGDGETLAVRFAPGVQAPRWDLRIDGVRHRAEWKGLERKTIASIDLRVAKDAVIAEVR
jgi:predicted metal-dependent enzyme (double-stranded beta helix superfamily)